MLSTGKPQVNATEKHVLSVASRHGIRVDKRIANGEWRMAKRDSEPAIRYSLFSIRHLSLHRLGLHDLDAEAGEAHIGDFLRGKQPDRGNPEIAEDLRAEPDLPPLARARRLRARIARRNGMNRHARDAV